MPVLRLTTEEIQQAGTTLQTSADQIQDAAGKATSAMSKLDGMQSPRLQRDIADWERLKKSVAEAVRALADASAELKKLAEANEAANR